MAEREPLLGQMQFGPPKYTEEEDDKKQECCYIPRRYILVFLLFLGTANSFAVRVNFNVALLAMVNDTEDANVNDTINHCPGKPNFGNSTKGEGEFLWSSNLQSVLLGAFYYGYPILQPFAGVLSEKVGPKRLIVFAGASGGLLNLLMPVVAKWNVYALVVLRGLLGIGLGPLWPSMATMLSRWTRRSERTRMFATCNAGLYVGTVISQSISGALCDTDFLGGWPSVFYLFGVLSLVWCVMFWVFTADSPAKHPSISREERDMIEADTGDVKYHRPPYGAIIRSVPVWCFFIMLLMDITSYDILFTYLPLYMKRVLHFDITASGGLSSIPYVISLVVTFLAGYSADVIRNRGWLGTMWIRRIYTFGGDMLPAFCVLAITFLNCNRPMVVFFFILAVSLSGINNGGFNVNMFDLAPRYAGTIYGVINGLSNIGGFVGPLAVGAFTKNSSNVESWHYVFYLIVALYSLGTFVFCVFGSAELQPWAEPRTEMIRDVPDDGSINPSDGSHEPDHGSNNPDYGSSNPDNGQNGAANGNIEPSYDNTDVTVPKATPPKGLLRVL